MKIRLIILLIILLVSAPHLGRSADLGQIISSSIGGLGLLADAAKETTPGEEHYIGRAVAATVISRYPLLENTALTEYINEVGLNLANVSKMPVTYAGYHFAVLNSSEENAFACPGGLIFITKGLLKKLNNEDELAMILGHEVAHVANRDGISSIKKSRWTKLAFYAAGEVGKNYSSQNIQQLTGVFQGVVGDVAKKVIDSGYSKSDEKKADADGLKYASDLGYNPAAIIPFMQNEAESNHSSGPFSSHPKASARLKMIESTISKLPQAKTAAVRTARFKRMTTSL